MKVAVILALLVLLPTVVADGNGAHEEHPDAEKGAAKEEKRAEKEARKEQSSESEPTQNETSGAETGETDAGNQTAEAKSADVETAEDERPCRLYRYEGFRPAISVSPLLGLATLDPDRCWLRTDPGVF